MNKTKIPIKCWSNDLENTAQTQIKNISSLPFIYKHVAVMPDAHAGKGSTIGTVIATDGAIIPSAVGVDIGCGMAALNLEIKADHLENLSKLRHSIERSIPTGRNSNREVSDRVKSKMHLLGGPPTLKKNDPLVTKASEQLGSLGSGNHFIEICTDTSNDLWILLHSGSRNIGKMLADKHISTAKSILKDRLESIPDPDLAYLTEGTREFENYIGDMMWAQKYAKQNRDEMLLRIVKDVSFHLFKNSSLVDSLQNSSLFRVDCHHNFCQQEEHFGKKIWLTRKGAVSAKKGEFGIIPGSMGQKSFIVQGLGNPDSFHSCSHGAGRRMSRTQAKKIFTREDLERETRGVECRKDSAIVDEIPLAYKDIDQVMDLQKDLIQIHTQLKQIICIKGD